jgi:PAS domain S-box-containing protein
MTARNRWMSWLLPIPMAGLLAVSLLSGMVIWTIDEGTRAEAAQTRALEHLARQRAIALGAAARDGEASAALLRQATEFPRVLDALLWRSDGTMVARASPAASGTAIPAFVPPGTREAATLVAPKPSGRDSRSGSPPSLPVNLWHPVAGENFEGWLQLVVDRKWVEQVRNEHLLQVAAGAGAVALLVWLCVLGVTRRTELALDRVNRFALELDGSGRQLPADPQNFELHGLVDALNQASLRLAEQQRLAKINEHELRALTGNIPGVVYQSLPDTQFTMEHLSQEFERLAGYPVAELIDNRVRSYADIIHPADVAKVRELRANAIEQRRPFAAEYRLRASDGSTRWVLDKGQGVFGDRGELMHLTGVIINDTARHSALSALARSEVRHRRLVELNVVEQSLNIFKVNHTQRRRMKSDKAASCVRLTCIKKPVPASRASLNRSLIWSGKA